MVLESMINPKNAEDKPLHIFVISVVFTWVYNNTNRSILSAILLHIVLEFCANTGLIPWDRPEHLYNVALWTVVAMMIIYLYGGKTLAQVGKKTSSS